MGQSTRPGVRRAARPRTLLFALVVLSAGLMGDKCLFNPLPFNRALRLTANPETCTMLQSPLPQALTFTAGLVWVADTAPLTMVPFDPDQVPLVMPAAPLPVPIPLDSDGNGTPDTAEPGGLPPVIDDIIIFNSTLSLLPTFNKEGVVLFSPVGGLGTANVSVPALFDAEDNPELPAPGTNRLQTGISTRTCVVPAIALDSRGNPVTTNECPASAPTGAFTRLTSGVAVDSVEGKALVSYRNATAGVHQPGVVSVYDFDTLAGSITPSAATAASTDISVIPTSEFSPSDIVIHTTIDSTATPRRFALVALSGEIDIGVSPPVAATVGGIDVIDIETLQLVATYPLGAAGISSAGIRIDPTGSTAVVGSTIDRELYAVDLGVLSTVAIPTTTPIGGPVDLRAAGGVIFERITPLVVPPLAPADPACPGFIRGLDFNHAGTRLFATDFCDGSFIAIDFFSTAAGAARFGTPVPQAFAAPRSSTDDRPRGVGRIVVRPEVLSTYDGPDVFALIDQPQGMICALFVEKTPLPATP